MTAKRLNYLRTASEEMMATTEEIHELNLLEREMAEPVPPVRAERPTDIVTEAVKYLKNLQEREEDRTTHEPWRVVADREHRDALDTIESQSAIIRDFATEQGVFLKNEINNLEEIDRLTADLNESERQTRAQMDRVLQRHMEVQKLRELLTIAVSWDWLDDDEVQNIPRFDEIMAEVGDEVEPWSTQSQHNDET